MLEVSISKKARLGYDLADGPARRSRPTPTQVRQVVMNLITNASEAIGEQRRRRSRSRPGSWSATAPTWPGPRSTTSCPSGLYVVLEVPTPAAGWTPETQTPDLRPVLHAPSSPAGASAWPPCSASSAATAGRSRSRASPGRGTTFRVLFPRRAAARPPRGLPSSEAGRVEQGGGTVLVVDDDETVRAVAAADARAARLRRSSPPRDGREAVDVFRAHRTRSPASSST